MEPRLAVDCLAEGDKSEGNCGRTKRRRKPRGLGRGGRGGRRR